MRELQEEFGILTAVRDYVGSSIFAYEEITIELLAYNVSYISGQFQLHSHEEIRWVSLDELDLFDFAEADVPFIKQLKETAKVGTSEMMSKSNDPDLGTSTESRSSNYSSSIRRFDVTE